MTNIVSFTNQLLLVNVRITDFGAYDKNTGDRRLECNEVPRKSACAMASRNDGISKCGDDNPMNGIFDQRVNFFVHFCVFGARGRTALVERVLTTIRELSLWYSVIAWGRSPSLSVTPHSPRGPI